MKAIRVEKWGDAPKFVTDAEKPASPASDSDLVQIKVIASGLHHLVRSQATGKHYSVKGNPPYIPGADGVGTTPDGKTVYFAAVASGGGFAEYINVPKRAISPIPEGADPYQIAGLFNPAMSSYMAVKTRLYSALRPGFNVIILGATSISGQIAAQLMKQMGAGKVIGVGRSADTLSKVEGLDETVVLAAKPSETDFSKVGDLDVVLDYLAGEPMVALFNQVKAPPERVLQYVNIATMSGAEPVFPITVLRGKNIVMAGSGPGAWSFPQLGQNTQGILKLLAGMPKIEMAMRSLQDVDEAWADKKQRTVFIPEK